MSAAHDRDNGWILDLLRSGELHEEQRREMTAMLLSLLEVMDSFDRLLAEIPEPRGVAKSCQLIALQLGAALERANVRPLHCLGQPVDLDANEVVDVRSAAPEQDDVVLDVVRRGYEWDGRLLRPAQVIVGRASKENSE